MITFILLVAQIVLVVCQLVGAISLSWVNVLIPLWIMLGYGIPYYLITWAAATQEKHPTDRK